MTTDNLTVFGTDYTGVTGIKATGTGNGTLTYIRPQGTKSISANGTGIDVTEYASVDVAVPTGTPRTSTDLTVSGDTVTAPAGYYASAASKSVASGTAGTPTATKGSVSNHSVSVTPSVTNVAGYIAGGTHSGTAVTVSASELVSGNLAITQNTASGSSLDVSGYATATVAVSGGVDCPTFTADFDFETMTFSNVACDKTLSECLDYIDGAIVCALLTMSAEVEGEPFEFTLGLNGNFSQSYLYTCSFNDQADVNVEYVNSNTITATLVPKGGQPNLQAKTNISPTTSSQTIQADSGYDGLSSVQINAMPSGTAGTPTATKGSVSNHSVSVTPSVTTTTGYISGGTKTGTAVTVSASELVSGSETKTANGTYDVTALAELVVSVASPVKTATGTFTGNGTRTIDVACDWEPDLVYFTSDPGTTASSGTVAAIIVRGMMTATRYRNNSTSNSHYAIPGIANMNSSGSSYSWRATYANSKVTLYCYSSNARALLTNGRTYSYTFMKWT